MLMSLSGCFRALIVMNFRTRATWAGLTHLPKIVLFVQAKDAIARKSGDIPPQFFRIVIFPENRDVQLLFRKAEPIRSGDQLPGERYSILLEVIAEREIAEHLEKREVPARVADVLEIIVLSARSDTFLG